LHIQQMLSTTKIKLIPCTFGYMDLKACIDENMNQWQS